MKHFELFSHALARFRSSQPLAQTQLWNQRHEHDLAIALRNAFWKNQETLPDFAIITKATKHGPEIVHVCLSYGKDLIDLFGTNVMTRLEELEFGDPATFEVQRFETYDDYVAALNLADYFLSYWPAEPSLGPEIQQGILRAMIDLTTPTHC